MAPAVTQLVEMVPAGPSAPPVAATSAVKPDARAGGPGDAHSILYSSSAVSQGCFGLKQLL